MDLNELFENIQNNASALETEKTPISDLAHKNDFTMTECSDTPNQSDYYECFHAEKSDGNNRLELIIETRDNYRSFGNDEEPYKNIANLYDSSGNLIKTTKYTYFG